MPSAHLMDMAKTIVEHGAKMEQAKVTKANSGTKGNE